MGGTVSPKERTLREIYDAIEVAGRDRFLGTDEVFGEFGAIVRRRRVRRYHDQAEHSNARDSVERCARYYGQLGAFKDVFFTVRVGQREKRHRPRETRCRRQRHFTYSTSARGLRPNQSP